MYVYACCNTRSFTGCGTNSKEHRFLHAGPCWMNMDKLGFDDQYRNAFGLKQEAHLRWTCNRSIVNWEEYVRYQVSANETYSEAKRLFSDRNILMNVHSPHQWWSTLKSVVFGSRSSLASLVSECGGLMCESVGKADLLSDHFHSKQSWEAVICRSLAIHL